MPLIIGAGPSELHAHIDLDHRIAALAPAEPAPVARILEVANDHGHWSVLADVRHR